MVLIESQIDPAAEYSLNQARRLLRIGRRKLQQRIEEQGLGYLEEGDRLKIPGHELLRWQQSNLKRNVATPPLDSVRPLSDAEYDDHWKQILNT